MTKAILDTDILSEYLKGHDKIVARHAADYARLQDCGRYPNMVSSLEQAEHYVRTIFEEELSRSGFRALERRYR